jgi:hypothetical protein
MAHYVVRVRTPRSPAEAFAYMADLVHFADWDPGVTRAEQVEGDGPGADAVFDVAVKGLRSPLRYRTVTYEPPTAVVVRAENRLLTSLDSITVAADGEGSVVTYDAELTLNGPLGLADLLLRPVFGRIADRAAQGLIPALDGERVPTAAP